LWHALTACTRIAAAAAAPAAAEEDDDEEDAPFASSSRQVMQRQWSVFSGSTRASRGAHSWWKRRGQVVQSN